MLAPEVIEAAEKRVGETIGGKWHLDRVIGVGGMAAVYEATHRNRNRVAIKLLHPALSLEEGTRHRFLREGYVANTIRHSGAVQVLDDDVTSEGYAFLVMELLRGESVEERMHRKGGSLDIFDALSITEQLLDVLEAAHDQNVIHRDIKPDNLFLTEEGKLKVLDFGIARLHQGNSRTTKVGSFMGTPAFCAQEQARGRWDEVDHRTDLYSVGASLFTCLTGLHVHEAETSSEQLALAIGATARSLADVMPDAPKELVDLVDMSLAYDKEDRFQSARAMRAAVRRVKAGLPVVKKVTTPAPPPSGARTFGPADLDPDSIRPTGLPDPGSKPRVLIGIVAACVVAGLIFLASRPDMAPGKTPPNQPKEVASQEKSQQVSPPPGAREAVPAAEIPSSAAQKTTASPPAPADSAPKTALVPEPGEGPADGSKPAPVSSASLSFPPPSGGSTKAHPSPSPSPAPSPASDPPADEGMFDRRF
jgi:serine/threonine protein kinase